MTRRHEAQLTIAQLVLFGVVVPRPEDLMDAVLRRIDEALEIERHLETFGRAPDTVATDRGFYSTDGEQRIRALGVKHPAIPRPGYRSEERILYEKQRWFRRARAPCS